MIFFARPWLGYVMYIPLSAGLTLIPWIGTMHRALTTKPLK